MHYIALQKYYTTFPIKSNRSSSRRRSHYAKYLSCGKSRSSFFFERRRERNRKRTTWQTWWPEFQLGFSFLFLSKRRAFDRLATGSSKSQVFFFANHATTTTSVTIGKNLLGKCMIFKKAFSKYRQIAEVLLPKEPYWLHLETFTFSIFHPFLLQ